MRESAPPRRSAAPQTCQATGLAPRTGASAPARFLHVRLLSRGVVCRRNRACAEPPMGSGLTRTENDPLGPSRIVARGLSFYPAALERVAVRASLPCPSPISPDTQTGSNVSAAMGPHLRDRLPDRKSRSGKVSPRPRRTIWISQETTSRIRSVSRWRLTSGAEQRKWSGFLRRRCRRDGPGRLRGGTVLDRIGLEEAVRRGPREGAQGSGSASLGDHASHSD